MKNIFFQKMSTLWKEFIPLSMSDVTMALGDPMVNGALTQLPRVQTNLSALGVIKSIVVLFESPIIMMLHASNTLSSQQNARAALRRLMIILCVILTSLLGIIALPFCFFPLMENMIGIPSDVAADAHIILLCLLPWPASIAIRRYFQGILIIHGQSKIIARAGFVRLFVLCFCLVIGYFAKIPGNILAGVSMIIAVMAETAVVVFAGVGPAVKPRDDRVTPRDDRVTPRDDNAKPRTVKEVWRFYWPLAYSMVLVWGGRALLIVCLARAVDSRLALAVWPLTWSLVVLFANATRMVQQVIIRNRDLFHPLDFILFACSVGASLSAVLLLICKSYVGTQILVWFASQDVSMLSAIKNILLICAPIPIFVAIQNVLQGFLISAGQTKAVNRATLFGTAILLICALIGVGSHALGANVAAYSMLISLVSEILFLAYQVPWKFYVHQYSQQQNIQEGV